MLSFRQKVLLLKIPLKLIPHSWGMLYWSITLINACEILSEIWRSHEIRHHFRISDSLSNQKAECTRLQAATCDLQQDNWDLKQKLSDVKHKLQTEKQLRKLLEQRWEMKMRVMKGKTKMKKVCLKYPCTTTIQWKLQTDSAPNRSMFEIPSHVFLKMTFIGRSTDANNHIWLIHDCKKQLHTHVSGVSWK